MEKKILIHISQLVTPTGSSAKHGKEMQQVKKIEDAAVFIVDGIIKKVGPTADILSEMETEGIDTIDLNGHAVLPGFVDSHTHFLFGGYRPEEFMMRLQGIPYIEIHKKGGGIQNTVQATRSLSEEEMYRLGRKRLMDMLSMGVTAVEGKSGYGLDRDCELRQLKVLQALNRDLPVSIAGTYLGAHSIPEEYKGQPDAYLTFMIREMLPLIRQEKLAEFVDIFCEKGVFTFAQSRRFLQAAREMGFETKIHADEIVSTKGAELAAELQAVSADHLLMISEQGILDLAQSSTIATLLPCTAFCLNQPYAPARKMIDAGCAVALASDYNPGSSFTNSIPLLFALSAIQMKLSLEEILCALTLNGAAAIKKSKEIGSIEPGKRADLVVLSVPQYEFLVYHTCKNMVYEVIKDGKSVYKNTEPELMGEKE